MKNGTMVPAHLEVDDDQEDDDGGHELQDVGQAVAVERLLQRAHLGIGFMRL